MWEDPLKIYTYNNIIPSIVLQELNMYGMIMQTTLSLEDQ